MTTTVAVATHLRASPDRVWSLVTRPATLVEVARGFLRFQGAASFPDRWHSTTCLVTRVWLVGLLPVPWRHHLAIRSLDDARRQIVSAEHGGPIRRWNHRIAVTAEGEGSRYLDEIEIDAGAFTPLVAGFAHVFYRYRQARWRRLARADARGTERAMTAWRRPLEVVLRRHLGAQARGLVEAIGPEAAVVAAGLPPTRPRDPLARNLHEAAVVLAVARVLDRAGAGSAIADVITETAAARLDRYPRALLRAAGRLRFSRPYQHRLASRAGRSTRRLYPGEWVFDHVRVPGGFGLDYRACPIQELFAAEGRDGLVPVVCALDFAMSERMGDHLTRTTTLADGGERCDFRYTRRAG